MTTRALALSLSLLSLFAPLARAQSTRPQTVVAFVDVNVVPMDRERVLAHQTVVVRNGRIAALGPTASTIAPSGATIVAAAGQYLMPGLIDMHVHLSRAAAPGHNYMSASSDYKSENAAFALLYLANGVTTVRNMSGDTAIAAFAKDVDASRALGPRIFTTGIIVDGFPAYWPGTKAVRTRAEASAVVHDQHDDGYFAVKVYSRLDDSVYRALVATADSLHMQVVGHIPYRVGIDGVLAAKQRTLEHLDAFYDALQPGAIPDTMALIDELRAVDTTKMPAIAARIAKSSSWVDPTMVADQEIRTDSAFKSQLSLVPHQVLGRLAAGYKTKTYTWGGDSEAVRRQVALDQIIVRDLHTAGVKLILGTDASKPTVLPGFSAHDELRNFVRAGLSPFEALSTGTRTAAEALDQGADVGTIEVGKRADLLLLSGNPLTDVANAAKRVGVMANGQWLTEATLQLRLHAVSHD